MCELLGLSFAMPVSADVSVQAFAEGDVENADGWGLAWYEDNSLAMVKEAVRWRASKFSSFLQSYEHTRSKLFIGHVRHATTGGAPARADTHPFSRELLGMSYCFAHNGTVRPAFQELALGRYRPIGKTDSEHIFCFLLDQIEARGGIIDDADDWRWLHGQLSRINDMGKFNCLMCDGQRLFCYRDRQWAKGLTMGSMRLRPQETRKLEDPNVKVNLAGGVENHGFIVATRPLNDGAWHPLRQGELLVLEDGVIRFSSERQTSTRPATEEEPQAALVAAQN